MTTTTESRAGFDPAPPPPLVSRITNGDVGGGGLTLEQVKAQNRLRALVAKRDAERPDRHWGKA